MALVFDLDAQSIQSRPIKLFIFEVVDQNNNMWISRNTSINQARQRVFVGRFGRLLLDNINDVVMPFSSVRKKVNFFIVN